MGLLCLWMMQEFGWVLVKAKAGYTWQLFKFCFFKTFIVLSSYIYKHANLFCLS